LPWTSAVFWQYSFTGMVPGITGGVDLDRFLGDLAMLGGFAQGPDAGTDAASGGDAPASPGDAGGPIDAPGATPDGGGPDAGEAADGGNETVATASASGGCSCRQSAGARDGAGAGAGMLAIALLARRRRARERY
jgi:hypothetical protein